MSGLKKRKLAQTMVPYATHKELIVLEERVAVLEKKLAAKPKPGPKPKVEEKIVKPEENTDKKE